MLYITLKGGAPVTQTYEEMMVSIREKWSAREKELSQRARDHFSQIRDERFTLGIVLRDRRKELGLSQSDVASLSGVQQAEISRIESSRANPTWETVSKLLAVLGMTMHLEAHDTTS